MYQLKCGIVYFAHFHFTTQIITNNGNIWYHDGIEQQGRVRLEGKINDWGSDNLNTTHEKEATLALYKIVQ